MSSMPQNLPGSSVGFGPQGFGPSGQHFNQHPQGFGPPLPPPPPAASAGPSQQFDYGQGRFFAFSAYALIYTEFWEFAQVFPKFISKFYLSHQFLMNFLSLFTKASLWHLGISTVDGQSHYAIATSRPAPNTGHCGQRSRSYHKHHGDNLSLVIAWLLVQSCPHNNWDKTTFCLISIVRCVCVCEQFPNGTSAHKRPFRAIHVLLLRDYKREIVWTAKTEIKQKNIL